MLECLLNPRFNGIILFECLQSNWIYETDVLDPVNEIFIYEGTIYICAEIALR
jgi:hypothetical protein